MYRFVGLYLIGVTGCLFAVFHGTVLLTALVLRQLNWISEDSYRGAGASLPIKVAEGALAALFAYKSLEWFEV